MQGRHKKGKIRKERTYKESWEEGKKERGKEKEKEKRTKKEIIKNRKGWKNKAREVRGRRVTSCTHGKWRARRTNPDSWLLRHTCSSREHMSHLHKWTCQRGTGCLQRFRTNLVKYRKRLNGYGVSFIFNSWFVKNRGASPASISCNQHIFHWYGNI